MTSAIPVWVWLPGQTEPVQAASLTTERDHHQFTYLEPRPAGSVPLDPVELRFKKGRASISPQLPGVIQDARPAGYGQDRLNARLHAQYQRDLIDLELLEEGPADGAGAIEVCHDIERKLAWRARPLADLHHELGRLEEDAPASRALRRANGDIGTSAGGERPKATFADQGCLWIVKMQDRGDRPGMPALEFTTMALAARAEISVPPIQLRTVGPHQAFMVQRFDRAGDPAQPQRHLFASAHTALQLPSASVRGHEKRSYLLLADRMRVWCRGSDPERLRQQLQELWKRMAFNALVGNTDDHPRNHGLLFLDGAWQLAPAFDITPLWRGPQGEPGLAMATGPEGRGDVDPHTLLAAAPHFSLDLESAARYLLHTSALVTQAWEAELRQALAPAHGATTPVDQVVHDARAAFALSQRLAEHPDAIAQALQALQAPPRPGRRRRTP